MPSRELQAAYNALVRAQSALAQADTPDGLQDAYVAAKADIAQARRSVAGLLNRAREEERAA